MKEKMINIRISEELFNKFDEFCKKMGFSKSKRIRILLEMDIENEK